MTCSSIHDANKGIHVPEFEVLGRLISHSHVAHAPRVLSSLVAADGYDVCEVPRRTQPFPAGACL